MKIDVTQKHIDKGQQYDCGLCPIALAVVSHYAPRDVGVSVNHVTPAEAKVNHALADDDERRLFERSCGGGLALRINVTFDDGPRAGGGAVLLAGNAASRWAFAFDRSGRRAVRPAEFEVWEVLA